MQTSSFVKSVTASLTISLLLIGCDANDNSLTGPGPSGATNAASKQVVAPSISTKGVLQAFLSATKADPLASGRTTWDGSGKKAKLSIRLEDVTTSGLHKVAVNGNGIGTINVVFGIASLELEPVADGFITNMKKGDVIQVANPKGALILVGSLQ